MKITKTIKITKEEQLTLMKTRKLLQEICSEFSPMPSTCDKDCPLLDACPFQCKDELTIGDYIDAVIRDLEPYDDNQEEN